MDPKRINICDNSSKTFAECNKDQQLDSITMEDLRFFSETTIKQLSEKEGANLLIFPHCVGGDDRNMSDDGTIITIKNSSIKSSNYMGFVGRGKVELNIRSRFDREDGDNLFLHYMLQKTYGINLFDLQTSRSETKIWDFLVYMFPYYLKRAMRQGLYKTYCRREYNDSRVRGAIDVARHIKQNIPFAGKIAYSTREYSYDNKITQLIRHTIEYLTSHHLAGAKLLSCDKEMRECVAKIKTITPTYNRYERNRVIGENLKSERHPYFTEYTFLQKLCIKILRQERLSVGSNDKDRVYGLLFDGAWLWEAYLYTLLKEEGFKHPCNNKNEGGRYIFEGGKGLTYPDFYNNDMVLDAKYKWQNDQMRREDRFQIITYMHAFKYDKGGLIYPAMSTQSQSSHYGKLKGYGGDLYQYHINISQSDNFEMFCSEMKENEDTLLKAILE